MIKFQANFSYRYINMKSVYLLSNSKPNKSTLMHYYSVPHTSQQIGSLPNNVLLGFQNESLCMKVMEEMQQVHQPIIAVCVPFDEAKYIAELMRMPIAVILDTKIDKEELHYEIHFCKRADRI